MKTLDESIETTISETTNSFFKIKKSSSLSGGCINQSQKLFGEDGRIFFCKKNSKSFLPFFKSEALALEEIGNTETINVPKVIGFGEKEGHSFLVLEFIKEGPSTSETGEELGRKLAALHQIRQPFWGWDQDNCIGATDQPNTKTSTWIEFYREYRLRHQFDLANRKGKSFGSMETLLKNLEFFFDGHSPHPSLLHGDLWGGNASCDTNGRPFIFDPASYYGDRETDLAFTYMFGGFTASFYDSYQKTFPLSPGFEVRKILYNLYHELNHFNLFGGGYASSAQSSINQLIAKIP